MKHPVRVLACLALWFLLAAAAWVQFESLPADGSPGMTVTGLLRLPEGDADEHLPCCNTLCGAQPSRPPSSANPHGCAS